MKCQFFFPLTVGIFLAGCAAVPYQPPASGPTATLLVRHAKKGGLSSLYTYGNLKSCRGLQAVVPSLEKISDDYSTQIKAGEPIGFRYYTADGPRYCDVSGQFEPKPGGTYVVTLGNDYQRCSMGLYFVRNGKLVPEPSLMKLVPSLTGFSCNAVAVKGSGVDIDDSEDSVRASRGGTTLDDLKDLRKK